MRVVDRVDDDPDTAIVVALPDVPAAQWDVTDEHTVATYPGNEEYPADAPIAVVVFQDTLAEAYPEYDGGHPIPPGELADRGIFLYTFPVPRLRPAPDGDDAPNEAANTGARPTDIASSAALDLDSELLTLAATLAERDLPVEYDTTEELIRVEQPDETYRIHPDGSVVGDGPLRTQLEDAVEEAFS
jgi:hypothetical protein